MELLSQGEEFLLFLWFTEVVDDCPIRCDEGEVKPYVYNPNV